MFRAAFNGNFLEGASKHMMFPDCAFDTFGSFVDWIYSQRIQDGNGDALPIQELVSLWHLADRCIVHKLQNEVLDRINEAFSIDDDKVTVQIFQHLYSDKFAPSSPFRRLLVDLIVSFLGQLEFTDEYPKEFLLDVINAAAEIQTRKGTKFGREKMKRYYVDEI